MINNELKSLFRSCTFLALAPPSDCIKKGAHTLDIPHIWDFLFWHRLHDKWSKQLLKLSLSLIFRGKSIKICFVTKAKVKSMQPHLCSIFTPSHFIPLKQHINHIIFVRLDYRWASNSLNSSITHTFWLIHCEELALGKIKHTPLCCVENISKLWAALQFVTQ